MAEAEKSPQTDAEREEQARAGLTKLLSDRTWRLNNLYWVQDAHGRKVKFRMNWAQQALYTALWWLNVVLKARQLGISTFCAIFILDRILFTADQTCGIIDKTDDDAKKKLDKVKFAYDHLDDTDDPATAKLGVLLKQGRGVKTRNEHEFELTNGSKVWAGTSLRGGTVQVLWVSELGYIAYHFPEKAKEIAAGALNTVHPGSIILIESTHEGGKYGLNYRMVKLAQEAPRILTKLDWRFHFFPWWKHPGYVLALTGPLILTAEQIIYFEELAKEGVTLTEEQKHWYIKKARTDPDSMLKEFPATPEEAVNAVVTGAIYGKLMSRLRRSRRIIDFEADRNAPLYTFWDIGFSDFTAIWLLQFVGRDVCALNYFSWHGETAPFYAAKVVEWERRYKRPILANYLPHDANKVEGMGSGKTTRQFLAEAGLTNIKIVPRVPDLWIGINQLRAQLPLFYFHKTDCDLPFDCVDLILPSGIAALEGYHTKIDATSGGIKEEPVHDEASHGSSALRTFAEAHALGMIEGVSIVAKTSKRQRERDDIENGRTKPRVRTGIRGHIPFSQRFSR